ncbi:MAG: AraC family transcriptional regulator [Telmatospirillum sp.]|nr:AraC family transcriptional regulator [Telmatospirillum sp.]
MAKGTISIAFVDGLLEGFRNRGFDADELLEQVGLSPSLLDHPHARVSSATYTILLRLIAQVLDDEFFGHDSRRMKVGSFALMAQGALRCPTMERAFIWILRSFSLYLDDIQGSLVRRDGQLQVRLRETHPERGAGVFAQETMLMFAHRLVCWLVNRRIPIAAAHFRYPPPGHHAEYPLLFCPDVRFSEATTTLFIDARHGLLPVVRSPEAIRDFLTAVPENLLLRYRDREGVTARIRQQLRGLAPTDWPGFDDLALAVGLSSSTLRRRLEAEGQSYQSIKDQMRRDMAIDLLSFSRRSVMDIAADLGFAETSAFHRAFKKWTDANPGEYRKTVLQRRLSGDPSAGQ